MIITTTDYVPGAEVASILGVARGNTVRAKHIGRDIAAGLKSIIGGEVRGYTELLSEAREEAIARMGEQAQQMGAHAVVNVRLATGEVGPGMSEILAYGTAVTLQPISPGAR